MHPRSARRAMVAALVAVTSLVAVGVTTQAADAASSPKLFVTHSKVMKGELFTADGTLSTPVVRQVRLQRKSGGSWKTVDTTSSDSSGYFFFARSASTSTTLRYYAPRSGSRKSVTSGSRKVTVVGQTASAFAFHRRVCANYSSPTVRIAATFSPARNAREVYRTDVPLYLGATDSAGHLITDSISIPQNVYGNGKTITLQAAPYEGSSAKTIKVTYDAIACI